MKKSEGENKKEDRRTRYTKTVICDALLSLMEKKPFEKISVTEVCRMADINRGSRTEETGGSLRELTAPTAADSSGSARPVHG